MKKDEAIDEFIRYMVGERGISKNTIITYKEDLMIFSSSTTKEEANDFNNNDIYEFIILGLNKEGGIFPRCQMRGNQVQQLLEE